MRRIVGLMVPVSVVGLMLAIFFMPLPSVSAATPAPYPYSEDLIEYVVIDDYWPMEQTGPGELVYWHDGTIPEWGYKYIVAPADGKRQKNDVDGTMDGDLSWGKEVDRLVVRFWKPTYGVWDLGESLDSVVVFPSLDGLPTDTIYSPPSLWPSEAIEYMIWGSNDFDISRPGLATWTPAYLDRVYRKGWSDVGEDEYAVCSDDYVAVWDWAPGPGAGSVGYGGFRYVKLGSLWGSYMVDPEIDAVRGVQEGAAPRPEADCGWDSDVIERGRVYSYTSIEVGSDNRTHIAFGGEQLYYAVLDGSSWQVQMVDKGDVGAYCSLALTGPDSPVISYYDAANGDLRYAQRSGGGWSVQAVDSAGDVGKYTSVAIDGLGRPGISYYDETNDDLKYAHWNGVAWDIQTVDSAGWVGQYTSVAFDGAGNPLISYDDATGEDLKYAFWNGVAWTRQTVDADGDVGRYSSLVLDGAGNPAISYYDETYGGVKYASWSGTSWQIQTVEAGEWVGEHTSLSFDAEGNPAISYYDNRADDLKYALWNGTKWDIAKVDSPGDVGSYTSLDIGPGDLAAISYFDATNETLKCARWNGTKWETETVSGVPWVGRFTSLAFDSQGNPGVSYYDLIEGDLKYAHWTGEYWLWVQNRWSIETVDSAGDVGRYTSLAFDAVDNPCISYYDVTQGNLKYAHWNGFNWEIATVESSGDVGSWSSLVLDGSGNPAISYYDATNGNLKYARWGDVDWEISTLDSTGDVGQYCSLAFDDVLGGFGVAYYDATNSDLKYVRWDGATWTVETVDSTGDVGSYCSTAFDCLGKPSISYHDATNGHLKYARWGGTYWIIEVVDGDGWVGSHTSLAFDAYNNPAISYHEASEGDLRYAHWNGVKWDVETADFSDWAGRYTSLDFDGCSQPYITYDTATNGDLKYAYIKNPQPYQPVNESPVDGADHLRATGIVLGASAFSDPCLDSHRASQWQVTTTPDDFCILVFDSGADEVNLLHIEIPVGVLSDYTTYYWHVRYQDCHGAWSEYSQETSFSTGVPPDQPVNVSPADGAVDVATAPTLVASGFSDPEPADAHTASEWQVTTTAGDYGSPILDETTEGTSLTQLRLGSDVLDTSTTYYWRVRYQDSHGAWSVFSVETSFTTAAVAQNPPQQPTNVSPPDGQTGVSLIPTLAADAFSDPDSGDTHGASQWMVTLVAGDYLSPVFDSGPSAASLTQIAIPAGDLISGTAYYWQVRYQDSQGGWSEWSAETGFTTTGEPGPAPEEGIPAALVIVAAVVSIVILAGVAAPLMLPL